MKIGLNAIFFIAPDKKTGASFGITATVGTSSSQICLIHQANYLLNQLLR
ncbi:MAG: hypothetical protein NT166_22445 [Candidatus Aminicenantes bacterium]|nr:hypothetical protein [Candidatus Aminicenantes bacterium]